MRILVFNGGSSSLKYALYECGQDSPPGSASALVLRESLNNEGVDPKTTVLTVLGRVGAVDAIAHRIVNGGTYRETTWITPQIRGAISAAAENAPVHSQLELDLIDAVTATLGSEMRQAAIFDTAFHKTLAPAAYTYPGPLEWFLSDGIRRYGFHGISYQYATRRSAEMLGEMPERMLLCHLGNGASLCAVRAGASVDTTMGFTPLEGLVMGTRSGSIDPGILIFLLRHRHYTAEQLDSILDHESGLLGVSGISSDMREILRAASEGNVRAHLAFDIYIHRLVGESGRMIAILGGLDALVFTGGVGENSSLVREALCRQLEFLGVKVDPTKTVQPKADQNISATESAIPILVIHAEEELEIARECWKLVSNS